MSAQENLNQDQFFHGTVAKLRPGSVIRPVNARAGSRANFSPGMTDPDYAYATSGDRAEDDAWHYAELAANWAATGSPRVYQVAPLGEHEQDPQHDEHGNIRDNMSGDRRSKAGWKVTRQMPQPDWAKGW